MAISGGLDNTGMFDFFGPFQNVFILGNGFMAREMHIKWPFNILKMNDTNFWKSRGFNKDAFATRTWNQTPVYWDRT